MQIYPKNPGALRPDAARTAPVDSPDRDSVRPVAPTPSSADRSDKVEISNAGRALAAREPGSTSPLDSARTTAIRGRVLNGAYDTLEVVDAVARRLLDSGDL
ncbi:MAG TPA: flagellar biosynthesis anti-sigma factor FlgM [Gemmatimonadaceae bacterium]|nr:flagellar biosynthesis anti-sigma factor FlgM [Gemmatimonadaceae bacterium]